jgi:hypothetical protein
MSPRLVTAAALLLSLGSEARAEIAFHHTLVDTLRRTGLYTSLALDAEGEPWIAYHDATVGDLKVARRRRAEWTVETVDALGYTGAYPSIALDAAGIAYVVYTSALDGELRFAWREPDGWRREVVSARPEIRLLSTLSLGPGGVPRFAALAGQYPLTRLDVWERGPGGWTQTDLGQRYRGGSLSFAAAADGTLYISVYADGDLFLYTRAAAGWWALDPVDVAGDTGIAASVRADSRGGPRIAYIDRTRLLLRLAWKEGGQWRFETADTLSASPGQTSLVLDPEDRAWIAYLPGSGGIRLAHQTESGWVRETVEVANSLYPSLALDASRNPRVSYHDPVGGYLRYADAAVHLVRPQGSERWPAGSIQEVHWEGKGALQIELSPDGGATYQPVGAASHEHPARFVVPEWTTAEGRLRLVRADPPSSSDSPGRFEIAPDLASPWWSEPADRVGFPGKSASLVVRGREPWVAYRSASEGELRVARRGTGGWTTAIVAGPYFGEGGIDFAFDAASGRGHVVAAAEGGILHLVGTPSSWTSEILPAAPSPTLALAIGPGGALHLAYFTANSVRLATRDDGGWREADVYPCSPNTALHLALDPQGHPALVFFDGAVGRVRLVQWAPSGWVTSVLPTAGYAPSRLGLAYDTSYRPSVAASSAYEGSVRLYEWDGVRWLETRVTGPGVAGEALGHARDAEQEPWIAFAEAATGRPWVARRRHSVWRSEPVDDGGRVGSALSLALDDDGQARLAYFDLARGELRYVSSAVELDGFEAETPWPRGAEREVRWRGSGRVELSWRDSTGGAVGEALVGVGGSLLARPPAGDRPLWLGLARQVPRSAALTGAPVRLFDGVRLLEWSLALAVTGGVQLAWRTEPAPADLESYSLERRAPGEGWTPLVEGLRDTSLVDAGGRAGHRYRLSAIDAMGTRHLLGERAVVPEARLSLWPVPWGEGPLFVGLRSGGAARARIALFDAGGRRVRLLHEGPLGAGEHLLEWDGRDDGGREAPAGVYFLEWAFDTGRETRRFVRLR